jgi:oxaloacetate decarboxylase gamma subunit
MTIAEMLEQSALLTLLGMSMVFSFLWIMIIGVTWVGKLVHALGLDKDVQPESETAKNASGSGAPEIAAIAAAITEYRSREQDSCE